MENLRHEIKYESFRGNEVMLKSFFLSNQCKEVYKERIVNSLYYDTNDFHLFSLAVNGISERYKSRARFYDDGKSGYTYEDKIKVSDLNKKRLISSNSKKPSNRFGEELELVRYPNYKLPIKLLCRIGNLLLPKTLITYKRKYFLSNCKTTRLTLDTNIIFHKASLLSNKIILTSKRILNQNIIEMKFDSAIEPPKNLISLISDEFNLTYSKCSKYCKAIESLY